ncbi:Serine/threonine protein kinase [Gracilaria domingensis]|nr:Serine/threonine protein kinase [Gracilaria domingensis]
MLVEFAFGGVFEDEKHAVIIVEVAKQAEDVRMSQMGLNLDLPPQLVLDLALEQLLLEQDFESDDVLGAFLACEVYTAVLALAQRLANLEVAELPGTGRVCVGGAAAHRVAMRGGAGPELSGDVDWGGAGMIRKSILFPWGDGIAGGELEWHG